MAVTFGFIWAMNNTLANLKDNSRTQKSRFVLIKEPFSFVWKYNTNINMAITSAQKKY